MKNEREVTSDGQEPAITSIKYPYTREVENDSEFKELVLHFNDNETFILKEKSFRVFKNIQKSVTRPDGSVNTGDMITKLISVSLIKPEMKDAEVDELPTSKAMSLTGAVAKLYNLKNLQEDFL